MDNKSTFIHRSSNNNDDEEKDSDKPLEIPILNRPPIPSSQISNSKDNQHDIYNNRSRDPRFDPKCAGTNDVRHFIKNYSFLDEVRQQELKKLEQALRKEKDPESKAKIKTAITRVKNKMVERKNKEKKFELTDNMKKNTKKSDIKKNLMLNKYNELKETGKLNKYLERKRKKLINRDKKHFS